ncbi:MAG: LuxR family transcriptional regulator [Myxococcales bacterium]|nr:MAG: LuxR family transcriptional regulator [Myxococcales bacterium]
MNGTIERPAAVAALSRREAETLRLSALGLTDEQAAGRMGISLGTVRVYRKRTQEKLGVKGVVRTMLVAWRLGLLDLETVADEVAAEAGWRQATERAP